MKNKNNKYQLFYNILKRKFNIIKEYKFNKKRKWRADFAIPSLKIIIEIEGGIWLYGRHNRPTGMIKDIEKYNYAASEGWLVLRFTPNQLYNKETFDLIDKTAQYQKNIYKDETGPQYENK